MPQKETSGVHSSEHSEYPTSTATAPPCPDALFAVNVVFVMFKSQFNMCTAPPSFDELLFWNVLFANEMLESVNPKVPPLGPTLSVALILWKLTVEWLTDMQLGPLSFVLLKHLMFSTETPSTESTSMKASVEFLLHPSIVIPLRVTLFDLKNRNGTNSAVCNLLHKRWRDAQAGLISSRQKIAYITGSTTIMFRVSVQNVLDKILKRSCVDKVFACSVLDLHPWPRHRCIKNQKRYCYRIYIIYFPCQHAMLLRDPGKWLLCKWQRELLCTTGDAEMKCSSSRRASTEIPWSASPWWGKGTYTPHFNTLLGARQPHTVTGWLNCNWIMDD